MRRKWKLVRVILFGFTRDEVTLKQGETDQTDRQIGRWTEETLGLDSVELFETVDIRAEGLGKNSTDVDGVSWEIQVLTGQDWNPVHNLEIKGSRYESTGNRRADYNRNRHLDEGGSYQ